MLDQFLAPAFTNLKKDHKQLLAITSNLIIGDYRIPVRLS